MKRFIFLGMTLAGIASQIQAAQLIPVPDIAPVAEGYHVVINIPQQRLFLYQNGSLKKVYPVGVGKAMTQTNIKLVRKPLIRLGIFLCLFNENVMMGLKVSRQVQTIR